MVENPFCFIFEAQSGAVDLSQAHARLKRRDTRRHQAIGLAIPLVVLDAFTDFSPDAFLSATRRKEAQMVMQAHQRPYRQCVWNRFLLAEPADTRRRKEHHMGGSWCRDINNNFGTTLDSELDTLRTSHSWAFVDWLSQKEP